MPDRSSAPAKPATKNPTRCPRVVRRAGNLVHVSFFPRRSTSQEQLLDEILGLDADDLAFCITWMRGDDRFRCPAALRFIDRLDQHLRQLIANTPVPDRPAVARNPFACDCGRDAEGGPCPRVHHSKCAYVQPRPARVFADADNNGRNARVLNQYCQNIWDSFPHSKKPERVSGIHPYFDQE